MPKNIYDFDDQSDVPEELRVTGRGGPNPIARQEIVAALKGADIPLTGGQIAIIRGRMTGEFPDKFVNRYAIQYAKKHGYIKRVDGGYVLEE